ncbi:acyltransferase family protein [Nakamurella leprariae]|uniref:Acyltransferase n=1 Tax=Nakamurella leprariae TaxID=2803911 RepID=A0A939BZD2_9ACTN|nr:acyltransferase family protein [Nakamurella leprariae]MBM9467576.1 acyltransferase [Nakamurella leprariae]
MQAGTRRTSPDAAVAARGPSAAFRPEIEGLRALACVLVVGYHVWGDRVSGGVDVFFVLTGFLLTGQLLRGVARGGFGPVEVARRWSRTVQRLVPATGVVLLVTAAGALLVLPSSRWGQTSRELVSSVLFVQNWQLASDAVDYAAQHRSASPMQHLWSLSVQLQVVLVAPVLVLAAVRWARWRGVDPVRSMAGLLTVAFAGSLACSIVLTAVDQPLAYFHTATRVWEFALGGLLALVVDHLRLPGRVRLAAGWVGVGGLIACGAVLSGDRLFPGVAALWPTGCAVLVVLAGRTGDRWSADRWLTTGPAQRLGGWSFGWYLWHWPLLIMTLAATGADRLGLIDGLVVVLAALGLAVLTDQGLDRALTRRLRRPRGGLRPAGLVALAAISAVTVVSLVWQAAIRPPALAIDDPRYPGAAVLAGAEADPLPAIPTAVTATDDWVPTEQWDCTPLTRYPDQLVCVQPVVEQPTRRVAVVGDSHAQQISGSLLTVGQQLGWQFIALIRGGCPFSTAAESNPGDQTCVDSNAAVLDEMADLQPDLVVTMATRNARPGLTEQTPTGFVDKWRALDELGIPVLAFRDNPRFEESQLECWEQAGRPVGAPDTAIGRDVGCGGLRSDIYATDPPWLAVPDLPGNVTFVDIADAVCDAEYCPVAVGNVLVYMDDNHLTATYSASMAPLVAPTAVQLLGDF